MIQIQKPMFEAATALGTQPPATDRSLTRRSQYVLAARHRDGLLLLNTLTMEMVLVPELTAEQWENADVATLSHYDDLRAGWYIVDADFSEHKAFSDIAELVRLRPARKPATKSFVIFTTSTCNARCFYCYEAAYGIKAASITDKRALEIADFISDSVGEAKRVHITWFGGEPLVNHRAIDTITHTLADRGITVIAKMVSNGYLFTPELVAHAKEHWNLRHVQITLDGTEDTYNRIKNYVGNPPSPFRRVMANIRLLAEAGIAVAVRLNMNADNHANLMELVDKLGSEFADIKKGTIQVYSAIISDDFERCDDPATGRHLIGLYTVLQDRIEAVGLGTRGTVERDYRLLCCMGDNPDAMAITPSGMLTPCEHHCDTEIFGDVRNGVTNPSVLAQWQLTVDTPACPTCPQRPLCHLIRKCEPDHKCFPARVERLNDGTRRKMRNTYEHFKHKAEQADPSDQQNEADSQSPEC